MYTYVKKCIGINDMNDLCQYIAKRFLLVRIVMHVGGEITSTFFVLFFLDSITPAELGILLFIEMGLCLLLDYPTAALGDMIGHEKILILAFSSYAIGLIFLIFGNNFWEFLPFTLFQGIGASQESGALEAWFDNQYRRSSKDPKTKIYGSFKGKLFFIFGIASGTCFVISGIIAVLISRRFLFVLRFIAVLIIIFLIISLIKPDKVRKQEVEKKGKLSHHLSGGLRYILLEKHSFAFYFFGLALIAAAFSSIWSNFLLFPLYYSYTGSDDLVGLLRSLILVAGAFWTLIGIRISKRVDHSPRNIVILKILAFPSFILMILCFYLLMPPTNSLVIESFLGLIFIFQFSSLGFALDNILRERLMLQIIPDEFRNSLYSLIPTLIALLSLPLIVIGSIVVTNLGFIAAILLVLILNYIGISLIGFGFKFCQEKELTMRRA
ncbi:MAG: MFS transporter [Candidatus Hodarchaeales archaeon]